MRNRPRRSSIIRRAWLVAMTVLLGACAPSKEQADTSEAWRYLAQTPPGTTAELFAPEIIAHRAHSSPAFTPDGKEIYWSVTSPENQPREIRLVRYVAGVWSAPEVAPFSGAHHDDQPFISGDGRTSWFASKRPKTPGGPEENDLWSAVRTDEGWSDPTPIAPSIGFWTPSATRAGTVYCLGNMEGSGLGIYRATCADGAYAAPEFLPPQINLAGARNWCPFIAPDESYLLFSSARDGGFGSGDLYICFRSPEDAWSEAVNLGPAVNTDRQERFPGVSPDGRHLFFTRGYAEPNLHDMYWIDAGILEDCRSRSVDSKPWIRIHNQRPETMPTHYRQCELERTAEAKTTHTVTWLPENHAVRGRTIGLKRDGEWVEGRRVVSVGSLRRPEQEVLQHRDDHRTQRRGSDI